jgi:hypothetical protein
VARFPGRAPAIFNVPPRNPNFTGHGDLLQALRRQLRQAKAGAGSRIGAIYGLGGVGKTQLAIECSTAMPPTMTWSRCSFRSIIERQALRRGDFATSRS